MKKGLAIAALVMMGCGESRRISNCDVVPEENRQKMADFILTCINSATAKTTGEDQDAAGWVRACRYTAEKMYSVRGTLVESDGGVWDEPYHPVTPCKEVK